MSTTTATERAYGPMSWGINPNSPATNEAWAKRMEHAAIVLNRAADVFYAEAMPKVGGRLGSRAAALAFSVESVPAPAPFGFHAAYKWLTSELMEELLAGISYAS